MNGNPKPVAVNLATRPARNRRLFDLLRVIFIGIMVMSAALLAAGLLFYGLPSIRLRAVLAEQESNLRRVEDNLRRAQAGIAREKKGLDPMVASVNAIIDRKSFSWTALLTRLEKALPDSCWLSNFSPSDPSHGAVEMRIKVVSGGLPDLMLFIDRLKADGFTDIRTASETRNERSGLVSELTLTGRGHE